MDNIETVRDLLTETEIEEQRQRRDSRELANIDIHVRRSSVTSDTDAVQLEAHQLRLDSADYHQENSMTVSEHSSPQRSFVMVPQDETSVIEIERSTMVGLTRMLCSDPVIQNRASELLNNFLQKHNLLAEARELTQEDYNHHNVAAPPGDSATSKSNIKKTYSFSSLSSDHSSSSMDSIDEFLMRAEAEALSINSLESSSWSSFSTSSSHNTAPTSPRIEELPRDQNAPSILSHTSLSALSSRNYFLNSTSITFRRASALFQAAKQAKSQAEQIIRQQERELESPSSSIVLDRPIIAAQIIQEQQLQLLKKHLEQDNQSVPQQVPVEEISRSYSAVASDSSASIRTAPGPSPAQPNTTTAPATNDRANQGFLQKLLQKISSIAKYLVGAIFPQAVGANQDAQSQAQPQSQPDQAPLHEHEGHRHTRTARQLHHHQRQRIAGKSNNALLDKLIGVAMFTLVAFLFYKMIKHDNPTLARSFSSAFYLSAFNPMHK
eukprot:GEZU01022958.1.p1 GENE.GEZU01022958.1~~GEZU01022958.1.p1  ORF type:complete len:494 (+),score=96.52 GEZU01022958.1:86-1567(+)